MKITVMGTGYVGLVTGACFANVGNEVICVDMNEDKIKLLNKSQLPIYEPGLSKIIVNATDNNAIVFSSLSLIENLSSKVVIGRFRELMGFLIKW